MIIKTDVSIRYSRTIESYMAVPCQPSTYDNDIELAWFPNMEFEVPDHDLRLVTIEGLVQEKEKVKKDASIKITRIEEEIQRFMALPAPE